MDKCHICGDQIWEDRWRVTDEAVRKNVCSFCFSKVRNGGRYRPMVYKKSSLAVCDRCGDISENVKLTSGGWFCEACAD